MIISNDLKVAKQIKMVMAKIRTLDCTGRGLSSRKKQKQAAIMHLRLCHTELDQGPLSPVS